MDATQIEHLQALAEELAERTEHPLGGLLTVLTDATLAYVQDTGRHPFAAPRGLAVEAMEQWCEEEGKEMADAVDWALAWALQLGVVVGYQYARTGGDIS